MKKQRIKYIDSIRSIAILMVLEGHFITQSLQTQYRDDSNNIYAIWKFTRGLTAPIFLFISGLIFTYLLLTNKTQGLKNTRIKKGIKRALQLISIGYLLQLNLYSFFVLNRPLITNLFQIYHILQCIGSAILIITSLYIIKTAINKISLGLLTFISGLFFFCLCPTTELADFSNTPQFIENILIASKNPNYKPSVFPLFPWCGYVMFGATLGAVFKKYTNIAHSYLLPLSLVITGFLLNKYYYTILGFIFKQIQTTSVTNFTYVYHLARLGQILMVLGVYIFLYFNKKTLGKLFSFIPWNNNLFIKIGQNTLSIFILHVIILYQGFFGWKINELTSKQLSPVPAIIGAIIFISFFVMWVKYLEQIKTVPGIIVLHLNQKIFNKIGIPFSLKNNK